MDQFCKYSYGLCDARFALVLNLELAHLEKPESGVDSYVSHWEHVGGVELSSFPLTWKLTYSTSGLITSIVRFIIFYDTEGFIDGTWTSGMLAI